MTKKREVSERFFWRDGDVVISEPDEEEEEQEEEEAKG